MAAGDQVTPPPGFTLDAPPPPEGFTLDTETTPEPRRMSVGDAFLMGAKNTLLAGPGGVLGLVKALDKAAYDAGGKVTDLTGSPELGLAANVAVQAVPTVLGGMGGSKVAASMDDTARGLMQSALKPSIAALRTGKAAKAIDTMLAEGISVTPGGLAKLRSMISGLNDEIATAIKSSPATVNKVRAASTLRDTLNKFRNQVNPQSDMAAINKAWIEFRDHPLLIGQMDMPVQTAQQLKQGTYKMLGEKAYGELKGAEIEAQKAIARGLKDEIASAVPGIANMNARESALLNAMSVAERRVLMDANKNPAGLSLLTNHPVLFTLFMADRSPAFKSLVARMLKASPGSAPTTVGAAVGGAAGAYSGQPSE